MYLDMLPYTQLAGLSSGVAGVRQTLDLMRRFVSAGKKSPVIREAALGLVNDLRQKDYLGEITVIQNYVRDHIRYVRDIHEVETVQGPEYTLDKSVGDCDDKAILLASLLESIGVKTAFEAVGFRLGSYSHVLTLAAFSDKWLPLEVTMPDVEPGWYPPRVVTRMRVSN